MLLYVDESGNSGPILGSKSLNQHFIDQPHFCLCAIGISCESQADKVCDFFESLKRIYRIQSKELKV